ncbi:MAG: DUF4164 family protein [Hyphomicrobiaceae bacterium]|nr:DUF4164 family protein [Hyphomicrobiaceae bacterium]
MDDDKPDEPYAQAEARVNAALTRLEASLRSLNGRVRSLHRIEEDVGKLEADRSRLANELRQQQMRADKLDKAAGDVSRRLVEAMDRVRTVMTAAEESDG